MGCPQHGRREMQRRGWAGTGGSPKGKEADLSAAAGKLQIRTLHENRAGAGRAGLGSKDTTLLAEAPWLGSACVRRRFSGV